MRVFLIRINILKYTESLIIVLFSLYDSCPTTSLHICFNHKKYSFRGFHINWVCVGRSVFFRRLEKKRTNYSSPNRFEEICLHYSYFSFHRIFFSYLRLFLYFCYTNHQLKSTKIYESMCNSFRFQTKK